MKFSPKTLPKSNMSIILPCYGLFGILGRYECSVCAI